MVCTWRSWARVCTCCPTSMAIALRGASPRSLPRAASHALRADPNLVGAISGLTLEKHNLPTLYVATLQALAAGTWHIIAHMNAHGYAIDTVMLTGGMSKNALFVQFIADATRCRVVLPKEPEAPLCLNSPWLSSPSYVHHI